MIRNEFKQSFAWNDTIYITILTIHSNLRQIYTSKAIGDRLKCMNNLFHNKTQYIDGLSVRNFMIWENNINSNLCKRILHVLKF